MVEIPFDAESGTFVSQVGGHFATEPRAGKLPVAFVGLVQVQSLHSENSVWGWLSGVPEQTEPSEKASSSSRNLNVSRASQQAF